MSALLPEICSFLQLFSNFRGMDDGVAYMVMGEGGEGGQPTQVVAVDNGDGTQQLVGLFSKTCLLQPMTLSGNTSNGPGDRARDLYDYRPPGTLPTCTFNCILFLTYQHIILPRSNPE